jgi:hypothetical protein
MLREFAFIAFDVVTTVASNCRPGELRHLKSRLQAGSERGRESLRDLYVDADLLQVGHFEQLLPGVPGVDQGADIRVARSDDAVEGGDNVLERFHRFQALHVGAGRIHRCLGRGCRAVLVVRCLL